ncbi:hypothetical protein [Sinorhizobium meliloti]|uniref:hypothetical protein n=1 Tax=Rhizobium meliloti TaxID=382 RepID=UPI001F1A3484|nr:hypothetical protein [Sinorhizobium meliloti]
MAVIAAAAPATSIVFLSAELMWESWAKSDPSAPPAILIPRAGQRRCDLPFVSGSGAVSRLLAEPLGKAEAAKLIHAAFSDADRRRVRRDIRILFED